MRFVIDKRYVVTRDKYQWVLLQDERPYKFFTTLDHLLITLFNQKISDSKASEIKQVIRAIKHAEESLCSLSTDIEKRFEEVKND